MIEKVTQFLSTFSNLCFTSIVAAHVSPPNDRSDREVDMLIHQPAS
jgi:hypothetical protein